MEITKFKKQLDDILVNKFKNLVIETSLVDNRYTSNNIYFLHIWFRGGEYLVLQFKDIDDFTIQVSSL